MNDEIIKIIITGIVTLSTFLVKRYFKRKSIITSKVMKLDSKDEQRKESILDSNYRKRVVDKLICEVDYYQRTGIRALYNDILKFEYLKNKLNISDTGILAITSNRITFGEKEVKVRLNEMAELNIQYYLLAASYLTLIYSLVCITPLLLEPLLMVKIFGAFIIMLPIVPIVIIYRNMIEPEQARILRIKVGKLSKEDHLEIVNACWESKDNLINNKNKKGKKRKKDKKSN